MKVIRINPAFNRYGGVKGHGGSVIPPNLCCLAAYVRELHDDVGLEILDSEVRDISHEQTVEETAAFSPGPLMLFVKSLKRGPLRNFIEKPEPL